jgi:hypothetical protein
MRGMDFVRLLVVAGFVLLNLGCASHRAATMCPNPAKVVGAFSRDNQEGWIIVRADRSPEDTAARIAASYHVRTRALSYLHGFSIYPVPQDPKLLCDKAIAEVHYVSSLAAR